MLWTIGTALAGNGCERVPLEEVVVDAAAARALRVREVTGALAVTGGAGGAIRVTGTICRGTQAQIEVVVKDGVAELTVDGSGDPQLDLDLVVPRALAELAVDRFTGALAIADLPARVSVEQATGALEVANTGALRVVGHTGPVSASKVGGDLDLDRIVGPVSAEGVAGEVKTRGVLGPVDIDEK